MTLVLPWEKGKLCPTLHIVEVADVPVRTALHLFTSAVMFARCLLW